MTPPTSRRAAAAEVEKTDGGTELTTGSKEKKEKAASLVRPVRALSRTRSEVAGRVLARLGVGAMPYVLVGAGVVRQKAKLRALAAINLLRHCQTTFLVKRRVVVTHQKRFGRDSVPRQTARLPEEIWKRFGRDLPLPSPPPHYRLRGRDTRRRAYRTPHTATTRAMPRRFILLLVCGLALAAAGRANARGDVAGDRLKLPQPSGEEAEALRWGRRLSSVPGTSNDTAPATDPTAADGNANARANTAANANPAAADAAAAAATDTGGVGAAFNSTEEGAKTDENDIITTGTNDTTTTTTDDTSTTTVGTSTTDVAAGEGVDPNTTIGVEPMPGGAAHVVQS